MDRYCPECNSTMTPSLVGYLCANCGYTQRFYSAQESALAAPTTHVFSVSSSQRAKGNMNMNNHSDNRQSQMKTKNKVKSTLKRLMVPEIAPPHPHLIGDGDENIQPILADKIEDETQIPAMTEENTEPTISSSEKHNATQVNQSDMFNKNQLKETPNQSSNLSELQSALHPQRNTSIWVMLGLAVLMLIVAATVLFLIILS